MNIVERKLTEITPYEKNPRRNDDAVPLVANSIKEFGFKQPIVVDKDGVIVAGHTRYLAAKKLKLKTVPCVVADDLTEEQIKAYRLADNKVAEVSEWDFELLDTELGEILGIDMEDFGFIDFELPEFEREERELAIEDDYDEELPVEPKSKLGDIYRLGRHRLICGDSTDPQTLKRLVRGAEIDMCITDPPYNVDYEGKSGEHLKILNDKLNDNDYIELVNKAIKNASDVMKSGGVFYIWYAASKDYEIMQALKDIFKVREILIWNKNSFTLGRSDYHWKHEPCVYGWKEGTHNWYNDRCQSTVIDMAKPLKSDLHPTMKPVPLFDYLIKNSTDEGQNVLDVFGGSGTTIIACEQNDRNAYMVELDPRYVDVIIDRWEQFTGETAVLVESGE